MKYDVLFNGNTTEGRRIADVKMKLNVVLKMSPEEIEKMFTGEPFVIASDIDLEACEKLIKIGKRCGAIFYIQKQETNKVKQAAPVEAESDFEKSAPGSPGRVSDKSRGLVLLDEEEAFSVRAPKFQDQNYIGSVADMLSGFELFEKLDSDAVKTVITYLRLDRFPDGHVIMNSENLKRTLYIIVNGKIEMLDQSENVLSFLGKGEVFGEMTLFAKQPPPFKSRAVDPATVLYITADSFKTAAERIPALEKNFVRIVANRLTTLSLKSRVKDDDRIQGDLAVFSVDRLFEKLNEEERTGTLVLKSDNKSAYITFSEGVPVNARLDGKRGEDAYIESFTLKTGSYNFIFELTNEEKNADPIGNFDQLMGKGMARLSQANKDFLNTKMPGF